MSKKIFAFNWENQCQKYKHNYITDGIYVLVNDASYMMDDCGQRFEGVEDDRRTEVFKVIGVNVNCPFEQSSGEYLIWRNNCLIEGADGKRYWCSRNNIIRFENPSIHF